MTPAAVQSIIDRACERDPDFAAAWYAECERQLVGLQSIPTQGIERTWSLVEGALQSSAAPVEAEAAKGSSGPVSAISGSTGAEILPGLTVHTPRPSPAAAGEGR